MATDEDYPIDLPILVTEAQICVAVKKFPFLPDKHIPNGHPPQASSPSAEAGGESRRILNCLQGGGQVSHPLLTSDYPSK